MLKVTCGQFSEAYIKVSNTGGIDEFGNLGDYFGFSATLYGDTLAVGAVGEAGDTTGVNGDGANNSAPDSGAVYLFTRSGGTWRRQAYLKASNTGADDWFGTSTALSGGRLAVGALYEDSSATGVNGDQTNNSALQSGAVYVRRIAP